MRGLFIKDFKMVIKSCKLYLIMILLFFAISMISKNSSFVYLYSAIFSGMIPYILIGMDERTAFSKYMQTLPVSRKQIVAEKYLFGIMITGALLIVIMAFEFVRGILNNDFSLSEILSVISSTLFISCLFPSISLPVIFKLGIEKGKILLMCIGGLIGGLSAFLVNAPIMIGSIDFFQSTVMLPLLLLAVSAVMYFVSFILSVSAYEKREF